MRHPPPLRGRHDALTIRGYEASDEAAVLELLRAALGESPTRQRSPDAWRWKHLENPFGPSLLLVCCVRSAAVVGLRAFMRWGLTIDGERVVAAQAVDTAVAPDYQRMGIFSTLTAQAREMVRAESALIFNTPNQYARPGYLKLGWHELGPVPLMARVPTFGGRPHYAPTTETTSVSALIERPDFTEVLARQRESPFLRAGIQTQRDAAYLRWHYADHPFHHYGAEALSDSTSRLQAALIYRKGVRLGLREALISEMFLSEDNVDLASALLGSLLDKVRTHYVLASFPRHPVVQRALRQLRFRVVPPLALDLVYERMFPGRVKPRRLLVYPLRSDLPVDVLKPENWHLTVGDLELF